MKILIIGDIVGVTGVNKVRQTIPDYIKENNIDFVIANGENAAEGMGITTQLFNNLINSGVDVVTMGNHTWGKKDIFNIIENKKLLRPANFCKEVPGNGYGIYECNDKKICVINLIGRVDMNIASENPFIIIKDIINEVKDKADLIIVDFHAEATAEKVAMGYFLDGEVALVFGTHTHIPTADEKILEKGTAYITDIGMTGPKKSVIGMGVEESIKRFLTTLPERYKTSTDKEAFLEGCILEVNDETCRATNISRIKL